MAERHAVVVMHGIGEQQRYSTLDAFVRGCYDAFVADGHSVALQSQSRVHEGGCNHLLVRATVDDAADEAGPLEIDFYEYYWASLTKGRIVWMRVLSWLRKTALAPIFHISYNVASMRLAREIQGKKITWFQQRLVLYRELIRFLVFAFLFLVLLLVPVWAVLEWSDVTEQLQRSYLDVLPSPTLRLIAGAGIFVFGLIVGWSAYRLFADRNRWETSNKLLWTVAGIIAIVLFGMAWLVGDPLGDANAEFRTELDKIWGPIVLMVLAVIGAGVLRSVLVKMIGDIALFVDSDERSDLFESREAILDGAEHLVMDVLQDDSIDRVYIAGHSLGSVVALATIDRAILRARLTAWDPDAAKLDDRLMADDLGKLSGLVTFGSPLDKVFYFFNRPTKSAQQVRAHILSRVSGFRRIEPPPEREAPLNFAVTGRDDPADVLDDMPWRNYYSRWDVVSGHLDFFHPVQSICMRTTHSGYWRKLHFYESVVGGWWKGEASVDAPDIDCKHMLEPSERKAVSDRKPPVVRVDEPLTTAEVETTKVTEGSG